jgi:hypothetical protein
LNERLHLGFPIGTIVDDKRWLDILGKLLWVFLLPFQYFLLVQLPGGIGSSGYYVVVGILVLGSLLAILFLSLVFGAASGKARPQRTRAWALALMLTWTGTIVLLAASYAVGTYINLEPRDIVEKIVSQNFRGEDYNSLQWQTFFVYALYSFAFGSAFALTAGLVNKGRPSSSSFEPNIVVIALINAGLLTVLRILSTCSGWDACVRAVIGTN